MRTMLRSIGHASRFGDHDRVAVGDRVRVGDRNGMLRLDPCGGGFDAAVRAVIHRAGQQDSALPGSVAGGDHLQVYQLLLKVQGIKCNCRGYKVTTHETLAEIERLKGDNALRKELNRLRDENIVLRGEVARLKARVAKLTGKPQPEFSPEMAVPAEPGRCARCGHKFRNSIDQERHNKEQCPALPRAPKGGEPWTCQGGLPGLGKDR